jgi:hypothetical protein
VHAEARIVTREGQGLRETLPWLEGSLIATLAPGPVRQFGHWLEHAHAIPGLHDRILDLTSALRLIRGPTHVVPPRPGVTAGLEDRLAETDSALRRVLARSATATWAELEEEIARTAEGTAVDFSRFHFGSARLAEVPEGPGIYRFLGEERKLLYIGKSRDLRRRILEYFRPLAPDHRRRAALLSELRDLEWEETPSELEALLLESEGIRAHRPPHNQKVDLHDAGEEPPPGDHDVLIVLGEGTREQVSVFVLRGGVAWARARLSRRSREGAFEGAASIARELAEGSSQVKPPLVPIGGPESLLVLRHLRLFGDRIDRIRPMDHPDPAGVIEALVELAERPRPSSEAWWMRAARAPRPS